MIFTKLSSENASKLFESTDRGKIFYLYRGDSNERMTVVQFIMQMHDSGLPAQPILVDCQPIEGAENPSLSAFRDVYLQRFPSRGKDIEKFLSENILAISNKFQDTWFWGNDIF